MFCKGFYVILSMKLSRVLHYVGSTIFKFRPERLQNLQRLQLSLVFSGILMLAFALFFFRNIF